MRRTLIDNVGGSISGAMSAGVAVHNSDGRAYYFPYGQWASATGRSPPMITDGNDVNIAAEGAGHRLRFFWAVNGTNTWHPETVAPKGSMA
jgi:hypothetical protein